MFRRRLLAAVTPVGALLTVLALLTGPAQAAPDQEQPKYCGDQATVQKTLRNGAQWRMCWRIDPKSGFVLEKVTYRPNDEKHPLMVLDSAALAQMNVPYDSGATEWNDITEFGFGGFFFNCCSQALAKKECPGGELRGQWIGGKEDGKKVLCVQKRDSGVAYRSEEETWQEPFEQGPIPGDLFTAQGQQLVIFTVSKVAWYEYITEWRFADDGKISTRVGATGDISPFDWSTKDDGWHVGKGATDAATSHFHNAVWRLDFNIDGNGGEKVEQYDTRDTGRRGEFAEIYKTVKTDITREGAHPGANLRWWRLVSPTSKNADGHPRSWELVQGVSNEYTASHITSPEVSFTQHKPCEKFASFNQDPECPAQDIPGYIDGQKLTDPVMWVTVGFHHIVRDEDQSPMPVHWQGFDLLPRDVTAQNPLTPEARRDRNGQYEP